MTEEKLRYALEEAEKKNQIGLLVWPSHKIWEAFSFYIKPGHNYFEFAISQTEKGKEGTVTLGWNEPSISMLVAVPVQKLIFYNDFFNHVLSECINFQLDGPITLLPSNEVIM